MKVAVNELCALVSAALRRAGANPAMADSTARALVLAESQGLGSHGLSRVALVSAGDGLAFPACALAVTEAVQAAREHGVAFAGVQRSHHCGVLVDHLRAVADAGMVGLGFANSPAAMPAAGGRHAIFGTNPVAAVFPRRGADPLLIDLSLSEVARGKLMVAAKEGRSIPTGWALDAQGQPTTDPSAGLQGSMLPLGAATSPKGAMLALVIELLVTALIGGRFGFEASSFFVDEGNRPGIGQAFVVVDPGALAGPPSASDAYLDRMEVLVLEMLRDDGVRLPGARREALRRRALAEGVEVPEALLAAWRVAS